VRTEPATDPRPAPKYVVLDGHTLGAVIGPNIQIYRASVIRGGSHNPPWGLLAVPVDPNRLRRATEADFREFGVVAPPDLV
jgi:hypothetical protein